jgi:hypothetical protein
VNVIGADKVEVFGEFNKEVDSLTKTVGSEKDKDKRFSLYLKSRDKITAMRKKNPRQAETQELSMSMFMDTMAFMPENAKGFKAKDCNQYKAKAHSGMQSYASDAPAEPYVEKAFKLIDSICK